MKLFYFIFHWFSNVWHSLLDLHYLLWNVEVLEVLYLYEILKVHELIIGYFSLLRDCMVSPFVYLQV